MMMMMVMVMMMTIVMIIMVMVMIMILIEILAKVGIEPVSEYSNAEPKAARLSDDQDYEWRSLRGDLKVCDPMSWVTFYIRAVPPNTADPIAITPITVGHFVFSNV